MQSIPRVSSRSANLDPAWASQLALAPLGVRLTHKLLVAVSNSLSYLVAMSWLRAVYMSIGGFQPALYGPPLDSKRLVFVWIWTLGLAWLLLALAKWLIRRKIQAAAYAAEHATNGLARFRSTFTATASDFIASAGAYAVMNAFAVAILHSFDTSTILARYLVATGVTIACSLLVVLGDKGYGPLSVLAAIKTEEQRAGLRFLLTFNMGFVMAFMWEGALEGTAQAVAPSLLAAHPWLLPLVLLLGSQAALTLLHWWETSREVAALRPVPDDSAASRISSDSLSEVYVPLLSDVAGVPAVAAALQLSGRTTMHALTLVGAIAVNFAVAGAIASAHKKLLLQLWLVYAVVLTAVFVYAAAALEAVLVRRAVVLAAAAGVTPSSAASLTGDARRTRAEGANGLLWYQMSVIRPIGDMARGRIRARRPRVGTDDGVVEALLSFDLMDKQLESGTTSFAFLVAFAWTNVAAAVLTMQNAQLAPPVQHYVWFGAGVTAVVVVLDSVIGQLHAMLGSRWGV